jgi:hypothetical protein
MQIKIGFEILTAEGETFQGNISPPSSRAKIMPSMKPDEGSTLD